MFGKVISVSVFSGIRRIRRAAASGLPQMRYTHFHTQNKALSVWLSAFCVSKMGKSGYMIAGRQHGIIPQ